MAPTITTPVKNYTGTTVVGPTSLTFKQGTAEHDGELPKGVAAYLAENGYGIDGNEPAEATTTPEPPDPRQEAEQQFGTPVRDAAVDPRATDFLPPTNAGQENPHGTTVVSPELHASEGVRPVTPGVVHVDDIEAQQAKETAAIAAAQDLATVGVAKPNGNASREEWVEYALADGQHPDTLAELKRDEIRDLYKDAE
ncbi:hypothetical protein [Arthrobacter sp. N1]|uniref:hypothetical protein n=1 Tax=Arthrobacter sp. N1 TaxID=619291 RepID=UPI003BB08FE5